MRKYPTKTHSESHVLRTCNSSVMHYDKKNMKDDSLRIGQLNLENIPVFFKV